MAETGVDQKTFWNGPAGQSWVEKQALFDAMYQPIVDALGWAAIKAGARRVLDVGCGTGASTLEIARALGEDGRCVGVDISEPMIASARENARREKLPAEFIVADAQTHAFEPGDFDMVASRFGVMFFPDPVAAFANLKSAVREGGAMRLYTWRHPRDNPFMTTAGRAAREFVPEMPKFDPNAPGQFGLAEAERVRSVLGDAGWQEIELEPFDFECEMPEAELIPFFTTRGPLGQIFPTLDAETQEKAIEKLSEAFREYVDGDVVRYRAATWAISARNEP